MQIAFRVVGPGFTHVLLSDLVRVVRDEVLINLAFFRLALEGRTPAGVKTAQQPIAAAPLAAVVVGQEDGKLQVVGFTDFSHKHSPVDQEGDRHNPKADGEQADRDDEAQPGVVEFGIHK